ncbi:MAG: PEF-CTERM sorting domain-containing protein [Candidatus Bathyarchaeia archaeon]
MTDWRFSRLLSLCLLTVFLVSFATSSYSFAQVPIRPMLITGNITLNGSPAPDGLTLTAMISGKTAGSTTTSGGQYTLQVDAVDGDQTQSSHEQINFLLNGLTSSQTANFDNTANGGVLQLYLLFGGQVSFSQTTTLIVTAATTASLEISTSTTSGQVPLSTFLQIQSNSTITNLVFDSGRQLINFTASGPSGTVGFASVIFAKTLINGPVPIVLIDNGQTPYLALSLTSNSTHFTLTFTYPHSTHQITIGGYNLIPEFPTDLALLVVTILGTTLVIARRSKRKH